MKRRKSYPDWRDETRPLAADGRGSTKWEIIKAKLLLKRGAKSLPLDLETSLMERGVDVEALKSKYQN